MNFIYRRLKAIADANRYKSATILGKVSILSVLTISQIAIAPKLKAQTIPSYCSILYAIDNSGSNFSKIYVVDITNATYNIAKANSGAMATNTLFLSAAAAIEKNTGRIFYISRDTTGTKTAYWDPATNTHTQLSQTFNAGLTVVRAAFSPSGRLFVATSGTNGRLFEINPTTGVQISSQALHGVSAPNGGNGDMAFDGNNVLFLASDNNLYTIDIDNFSASNPANLLSQTTSGTTFNSLGFKPDGKLYGYAGSNNTIYEFNTNTGILTTIGTVSFNPSVSAGVVGTDYASCAEPIPNLVSIKTYAKVSGSPGSDILPGDIVEYTITTTNTGQVPATKVTFQDPTPAGTTYVAGSTTLNGTAVADGTGGAFPYNSPKQIQSAGLRPGVIGTGNTYKVTIKYRVRVNTVNPPSSVTNQGTTFYLGGPTSGIPTDDPNTPTPNDPTTTTVVTTTTISGTLYEDTNGNGNLNPGEPKLPANITVRLLDTNNNIIATTNTDTNGNYTFTGVNNGSYKIQVDTTDADIPSGYTLSTANNLSVTVSGSPVTNQNFGFTKATYTISGTLYEDRDRNNTFNGGEPTLPANITVKLLDSTGTNAIATTTTNASGVYTFTGVNNGSYKIQVDTTDADIPSGYTLSTANNLSVTVSGSPVTNQNFGFIPPSNPNVLLIKRITAVNGLTTTNNGDNLAVYKDEDSNPYDDNNITITNPNPPTTPPDTNKWPNPATFLIGGTNGGNVRPGDELEYTIYFLSAGDDTAKNVYFCDRIPNHVTFIPTAFNNYPDKAPGVGGDRGILWQYNGQIQALTNYDINGKMRYLPPGVEPQTVYFDPSNPSKKLVDCGGENTNGAIIVNLGDLPNATTPGTPTGSYGFVRFRGRVK